MELATVVHTILLFTLALTVESITKFFEPVILEAGEILKWYNFCLIHESSNSCGTVATPPSLTVSRCIYVCPVYVV